MLIGEDKNVTFTVRTLAANFTVIASVIVYEVERSTQKYVEKVNFFPFDKSKQKKWSCGVRLQKQLLSLV